MRDRSFEVHFGWGAAIALALIVWGVLPAVAFAVAFAAGIAIELIQLRWPATGAATIEDAIYTGLGGVAGAICGALGGAA